MTDTNEKLSALEKRIKKHVIGKPHRFMAVAPLGFEETLVEELKYIGIECSPDISNGVCAEGTKAADINVAGDGKVEFTAKITEAWKAVAYSRIANRILMEIDSFKAENFGQLEKHVAEIPWELYIVDSRKAEVDSGKSEVESDKKETERSAESKDLKEPLCIHVTCKHSRLYHSDAVEERIRNIILKADRCQESGFRFQASGVRSQALGVESHPEQNEAESKDLAKQHLYVTLIDDRCTIWLDLAGEELYKRGHERFVAEAPLKETIAAAMIFEALKIAFDVIPDSTENQTFPQSVQSATTHLKANNASAPLPTSYGLLPTIIDPMAGSGTFSLEAAYIANGLIPGKCRDFALKHQPAFKEGTWRFLVDSGKRLVDSETTERNKSFAVITSDISERPISIIKHNVENSPLKDIYAKAGENAIAKINPQLKDFFSYTAQEIPQGSIILLNPPYGKRLDFDAPKLYKMIGEKLNEWGHDAHAKNVSLVVAILAPKDCTANLLKECPALDPRNNTAAKLIETSHGGFSLNAFFAQI